MGSADIQMAEKDPNIVLKKNPMESVAVRNIVWPTNAVVQGELNEMLAALKADGSYMPVDGHEYQYAIKQYHVPGAKPWRRRVEIVLPVKPVSALPRGS